MDLVDDVRRIISEVMKIPMERLSAQTRLETLNIDSLDFIEIVYALEEKFDVHIPLKQGEKAVLADAGQPGAQIPELQMGSIADIAGAVKKLIDAKARG